jgi:hypothetical protein
MCIFILLFGLFENWLAWVGVFFILVRGGVG